MRAADDFQYNNGSDLPMDFNIFQRSDQLYSCFGETIPYGNKWFCSPAIKRSADPRRALWGYATDMGSSSHVLMPSHAAPRRPLHLTLLAPSTRDRVPESCQRRQRSPRSDARTVARPERVDERRCVPAPSRHPSVPANSTRWGMRASRTSVL